MQLLIVSLLALVLLAIAIYAQWRVPHHTAGASRAAALRAVLIVVGLAFGYAMSRYFPEAGRMFTLLVFIAAFGLVHVPAAIILFVKHQRGAGKS